MITRQDVQLTLEALNPATSAIEVDTLLHPDSGREGPVPGAGIHADEDQAHRSQDSAP